MTMSSFSTIATKPFQKWCSEAAAATLSDAWQREIPLVLDSFSNMLNHGDQIAAFKLLRSLQLKETRKQVAILLRCGTHLRFLQPQTFHLFIEMWKQHERDAGFDQVMLRCLRELTIT